MAEIRACIAPPVEWQVFLEAAEWHGLLPLAHRALTRAGADIVPAPVLEALSAARTLSSARSLALTADLVRVMRLFAQHDLPALPYKGPAVAQYVYGDVALRPYVDLDVVVARRDVERARRLLLENGFLPVVAGSAALDIALSGLNGHVAVARDEDAPWLELHWRFVSEHFSFPLRPEDALCRAERLTLAGEEMPTLCAEDLLLTLCVHGTKHVWWRLEWLATVAALLQRRRVDWKVVRERADALGARRALRLGLRLAHEWLGAPLPADVAREVRVDVAVDGLAATVHEQLFGGPTAHPPAVPTPPAHSFHLKAKERLADKARYLAVTVLSPTTEELASVTLPDRLLPLYRIIRPVRLLGKYGRRVFASGAASALETQRAIETDAA